MVERDGFEVIDGPLPLRPSDAASMAASTATTVVEEAKAHVPTIDVLRLQEKNALLVSVNPPLNPPNDIPHAPCDIVLVIDISGSMCAPAPLPPEENGEQPEHSGLSVLDLTKHAARTIIETLNENDRLGVVSFESQVTAVFELSKMTKGNKETVLEKIDELTPRGKTNLWHGLKSGLGLLADADPISGNLPALFVLTDGMPNHMCPAQGYVPKLRPLLQKQLHTNSMLPLINTFGFGYKIRSGLLESISEVSGGRYGFIPESGMLGTVFIHAIANLFTTYATRTRLTISHPESMSLSVVDKFTTGLQLDQSPPGTSELIIDLGSLHYGQPREVLLRYDTKSPEAQGIEATLSYNRPGQPQESTKKSTKLPDTATLSSSAYQYQRSRAKICRFLRSLCSLNVEEEYVPLRRDDDLEGRRQVLEGVIDYLKREGHNDEQNTSLFEDLAGNDPHGQVRIALSPDHYDRWGRHYLLSLLNAHMHQVCNSFKDPGPLQYGKDSPFFCRCRQELDDCFDNLPPPKPSYVEDGGPHQALRTVGSHAPQPVQKFSMGRFRRSSAPCFAGHCTVRLASNISNDIAVHDLRPGMVLWTPGGPKSVRAVVATSVRDTILCRLGSLDITPWHPIMMDGKWTFPYQVPHERVLYSGDVYSVLLERASFSDAHALDVGRHVCVTLGHGVTEGNDARAHAFLGSYTRVARSLLKLPRDAKGIRRSRGIGHHSRTGLASSFIGPGRAMRHAGKISILHARKRTLACRSIRKIRTQPFVT